MMSTSLVGRRRERTSITASHNRTHSTARRMARDTSCMMVGQRNGAGGIRTEVRIPELQRSGGRSGRDMRKQCCEQALEARGERSTNGGQSDYDDSGHDCVFQCTDATLIANKRIQKCVHFGHPSTKK